MRIVPAMVDLRRTEEEKEKSFKETSYCSPSSQPDYPYGLCLSFDQETLEKLNMDNDDVCVGDMIHLHAMAKVTSVSRNDNETLGPQCRIELQLTNIAPMEDESDEDDEEKGILSKLYL